MKALVGEEKDLVGAFSLITNLRMGLIETLVSIHNTIYLPSTGYLIELEKKVRENISAWKRRFRLIVKVREGSFELTML